MSRFVKATKYVTTFEGDTVTAMLAPLDLPDALELERVTDRSTGDAMQAVTSLQALVPKYVKSLDGLSDAAGNPLTIQDVAGHRYFLELLTDLGVELLKAALPSDPSPPVAVSDGSSAGSLSPASGG